MPSELPIFKAPAYTLATDAAGVASLAEEVAAATDAFALDTETTGLDPKTEKIRLLQIDFGDDRPGRVVDLFATGGECLQPLWDALEDDDGQPVVMHNANFDVAMLWTHGCILPPKRIRDTLLQERCLTAGQTEPNFSGKRADVSYGLEDMKDVIESGVGIRQVDLSCRLADSVKRRLGKVLPKEQQSSNWGRKELSREQLAYAAADPAATIALHKAQLPLLKNHRLEATATLENELVWTMTWMQLNGSPVRQAGVSKLRVEVVEDEGHLKKALLDQLDESLKEVGHPGLDRDLFGEYDQTHCKPTSPTTFVDWMRKAGLELESLNKQELALSPQIQHPLMQAYRTWAAAVSLSKYATTLNAAIESDGRIYAGFRQYGAATGRMTSGGAGGGVKLNLQNIPKDSRFRSSFEAPEGYLFQVADYPAIEVQVIAHLSQDQAMLDSFRAGRDIYKTTASGLNGTPYDEVDKKERQGAKPLVLGLQFGLGAEKLGRYAFLNYGVALEDPEASRNAFFELYPDLKKWQKKIGDDIQEPGIYQSRTPLGRRRLFIGEAKENGYSAALNHPVQGMAADIMKTALVMLPDLVMEAGLETFQLVSVVHDEVLAIASESEAKAAAALLKKAMETAANSFLTVPLTVDVGIAKTWQGAKL